MMCGYLSAGATHKGEEYFRALMLNKDDSSRAAILALFDVYAVSQQQISNLDFEFQLMLPEEDESLSTRAQAFSEWCDGFIQGLVMAGVDVEQIEEEEVQDAIQHIAEFAKLDYDSLNIDEEDERALMEVSEYARMAVLRIYGDLKENHHHEDATQKAH
ncbi:hypothetical protein GCM10007966_14800 [Legionella impletisoli]|uniref:YecA family protein n=2 Tax=Legionella impletisoli TaxID=343510 RepID=A0A917JWF8_9GAMM|nr:hypothetical protein GCM10007966_14800 [Legionella impletisoli]